MSRTPTAPAPLAPQHPKLAGLGLNPLLAARPVPDCPRPDPSTPGPAPGRPTPGRPTPDRLSPRRLALAGLALALGLGSAAPGLAQVTPPSAASAPPVAPAAPAETATPTAPPPAAAAPPAAPATTPAPPEAAPPTSPAAATTTPAPAARPGFDCVGAEQLEDDAFAIPFARGAATLAPAADGALEALLARARAEPTRPICILGHAGPQEGGATANTRLAARRAAAVAEDLAKRGLQRDRLRAEIRVAAFARAAAIQAGRSVTAVLLPAP